MIPSLSSIPNTPAAAPATATPRSSEAGCAAATDAPAACGAAPSPAMAGPEAELLATTPCRVSKSYAPAVALVLSGAAEWVGTPPFETLVATMAYRLSAGLAAR